MQASEQLPGRSAAEEGGRQDDRDRGTRQARRHELERGHLPHRPVRRHPVRQQRQRHQRRLLPERRQDPAPGDRADRERRSGARLGIAARYGFIDATFRSDFVTHSPANSSADANGDIVVASGNRIPGIPQHTLRVRLDFAASEALTLGANLVANSSIRSRGDENNQDAHGVVPGYAVLNLDGAWRFAKDWELFARIDNVFNRDYANFGILGFNVFPNPGGPSIPPTRSPSRFSASEHRAAHGSGCDTSGNEGRVPGPTGKSLSRQRMPGRNSGSAMSSYLSRSTGPRDFRGGILTSRSDGLPERERTGERCKVTRRRSNFGADCSPGSMSLRVRASSSPGSGRAMRSAEGAKRFSSLDVARSGMGCDGRPGFVVDRCHRRSHRCDSEQSVHPYRDGGAGQLGDHEARDAGRRDAGEAVAEHPPERRSRIGERRRRGEPVGRADVGRRPSPRRGAAGARRITSMQAEGRHAPRRSTARCRCAPWSRTAGWSCRTSRGPARRRAPRPTAEPTM